VWRLERSGGRHTPGGGIGLGGSGANGTAFAAALFEAEAVAVHLQDVDVVGEAVEQRAGEPFRAEDFGPFSERQVAELATKT
jgi:hypothetical protein